MAKSPTADAAANADILKRDLRRLMVAIFDGGGGGGGHGYGGGVEAIEEAIRVLGCLRKLELKAESDLSSSSSPPSSPVVAPKQFLCPLSKKIMSDPVILATGQTFERLYIQRWLAEGNRTCPGTKEVLSHTILTPNHLIRDLISQWCKDNRVELPKPASNTDETVTDFDRDRLNSLLQKISSASLSDQKEAAKELRCLTKRVPSFRLFFVSESPDSITRLLSPLSSSANAVNSNPELQEDLITTLFNLSIPEKNKSLVAANPVAISLLVKSLAEGTIETRRNAAAALFSLSTTDPNKFIIGNSDALKPLIDLIDEGDSLTMKDAASAVFNLCTVLENKEKAVRAGAIRVLTKKIQAGLFLDESLSLLALLSTQRLAVEEMVGLGLMSNLFSIMREMTSSRVAENSVAILFDICDRDRSRLSRVREEENYNTLKNLAVQGTERAKRKANRLIQKLKRSSAYDPHTA